MVVMGDLCNAFHILSLALKEIGIPPQEYHARAIKQGDPSECIKILRRVLLGVSVEVSEQVYQHSLDHDGMSDKKFISIVFRYLREQSKYFPVLSPVQFHYKGFGEHKMLMIAVAARHVLAYLEKDGERVPVEKKAKKKRSHKNKNAHLGKRKSQSHTHSSSDVDNSNDLQNMTQDSNNVAGGEQEAVKVESMSCETDNVSGSQDLHDRKNACGVSHDNTELLSSQENCVEESAELPEKPSSANQRSEDDILSEQKGVEENQKTISFPFQCESEFQKSATVAVNERNGTENNKVNIFGSSNLEKELSAIVGRDELFADSVASCNSDNLTRAEFIVMMEKMESRLRSEYMASINALRDRVHCLEEQIISDNK